MKKHFFIFSIYLSMALRVYWSNRKETLKLISEINQMLKDKGYELSNQQIERIEFYTIQSCITNQWFSILRGKRPDTEEKLLALHVGAITPLLDDYTDDMKGTSEELFEVLNRTKEHGDSLELTIGYLYHLIQKNSDEKFHAYINKTLESQVASLSQNERKSLSERELKNITNKKGGTSTLLYRKILKYPLKEGEEEAIFNLGYLLQLTNDMFDIYEDYHNSQQTLFTSSPGLKPILQDYQKLYKEMSIQFLDLDYDSYRIKRMLLEISAVISRGLVCSKQLLTLQEKRGGELEIDKLSRKDLICDMEKPSNIWKSIKYSIQYYSLLQDLIKNRKSIE